VYEQSPEDRRAGILRFSFGGEERTCPTLKIGASRDWLKRAAGRLPVLLDALGLDSDTEQSAFVDFSYQTCLELVLEYDASGALGGREWLEEHADPAQLYDALRLMARVAVPFGNDLQSLVAILVTLVPELFERVAPADGSDSTRSTSSPSPSGASTRRRSRRASTRRS
jgi:hypothetical protein